jgi:hypothetical protein
MISTLTVSGSLIVSGGLTVNQLARKNNLVVYLDASPSIYTAYPFNSGSQSGTNTSTLTWSNRWTDLSNNNNHAYPFLGTSGVTTYNSFGFPLTSSYLNTGVYISSSGQFNRPGFRLNPIIETSSLEPGYSISMWLKLKSNGPTGTQFIIGKRNATGINQQYQFNSGGSGVNRYIRFNFWYSTSIITVDSTTVLNLDTWYNLTAVVRGLTAGSLIEAYINGRLESTGSVPVGATLNTISQQIIIGRNSWLDSSGLGSEFDLSQLLIYNCALTRQEVWNNYQITKYKHQA